MTLPNDWIPFLQDCADIADDVATHYYQKKDLLITTKGDDTPVTQADQEIEQKIRDYAAQFTDLSIVGEEYGESPEQTSHTLIIDPIDGTKNFIYGIPYFAALLGIQHKDTIIAGLISASQTKDRWWAERQKGSYHNGQRLQVSTIDTLQDSQIFHGSLYGQEAIGAPSTIFKLLSQTKRQRGFGDYYAPMYVAKGCGEISIDFNLKPWDMAPIGPIIEEAGGKVTHLDGAFDLKSPSLVCTNGVLHNQILEILNN